MGTAYEDVLAELGRLRAEVAAPKAERADEGAARDSEGRDAPPDAAGPISRRGLLRKVGGAAAAGVGLVGRLGAGGVPGRCGHRRPADPRSVSASR